MLPIRGGVSAESRVLWVLFTVRGSHVLRGDGMGSMAYRVSDRLPSVFVLPHPRTVHGHSRWHSRVPVEPHVFLRFLNSYCFHGHRVGRDCFISSQLSCRVTKVAYLFICPLNCLYNSLLGDTIFSANILSLKFPMSDFCIC